MNRLFFKYLGRSVLCIIAMFFFQGCSTVKTPPTLTFFGRATVKLTASDGSVAFIDPYAPGDYSTKASLVLVTHGHDDHNNISLVTMAAKCADVIEPRFALAMHTSPNDLYNEEKAKLLVWKSTLQLEIGTIIQLESQKQASSTM